LTRRGNGPAAGARAPLSITVAMDPADTSQNQRLHWAVLARRKKRHQAAALVAWLAAGRPRLRRKVRVSVIVRRGRKMDDDNIIGGLKAARDFLFGGGRITPSDSPEWVEMGTVTQQTGIQWRDRAHVVFVIE
jgi:hypothetical protein